MSAPVLVPTDPTCVADRHCSRSAFDRGCRCPESVAAIDARRASQTRSHLLREQAKRDAPPALESEPNYVAVELVVSGRMSWRQIEDEMDRVAIVAELDFQGWTWPDIALRFGIDERTTRRLVATARHQAGTDHRLDDSNRDAYRRSLLAQVVAERFRLDEPEDDEPSRVIARRRHQLTTALAYRTAA